ncbi:MAG: efflux RND transporter permease subunit [Pseudomonadota bacterium]
MSTDDVTRRKGIIAWFAHNPVAANLMMFLIIGLGIYSAITIRKQTTPDFEANLVQVSVAFPGAAPQEVEEGIVIKIEDALQDVSGIKEINGSAREGVGNVTVEVETDADLDQVLNQVKTRVDSINSFPELAERPVIERQEFTFPVIFASVYGDLDEFARKELALDIRTGLLSLPGINDVEVYGDRDYEISIEVSQETLRQYGLTMTEIARAIRDGARDIPGGTIETRGGDILLRTQGQVYTGQEYADLVIRTFADGTRLRLRDIAKINDAFVDNDGFGRYKREPNVTLNILASGQENELATAAQVRTYMDSVRDRLPEGVSVDVWVDRSAYLKQRLDLMLTNLTQGALLVFVVLTLFLRLKFALWVIVGIPVTFFGALWLMPLNPWPATINMISLFGFILVLGIVVDDAIIIGESIYTNVREKGHSVTNVIDGAHRVAVAATFGVLTTIAAFAPMLAIGGFAGAFLTPLSVVVALCLVFSLVESKLILPAHLAHSKITPVDEEKIFSPYLSVPFWTWPLKAIERAQRRTQHGLQWVIKNVYSPVLSVAVRNRGLTVTTFFGMLIVTMGLFAGGLVRFVFFPEIPGEFMQMDLTMQNGTPTSERNRVLLDIENDLYRVRDAYLESNPDAVDPLKNVATFTQGPTSGTIIVEMPPAETQTIYMDELTALWREAVGDVAGARTITFSDGNPLGGGPPLSFSFSGSNYEALEQVSELLSAELRAYQGVFDIRNSASPGGDEIQLQIKPEAEALGITLAALGTQVRQAFFGEEVQRIQRGTDELKVMLRYPEAQRASVASLENMLITTPDGDEVPFFEVAEVTYGDAYSVIARLNGRRTVTVSADLDPVMAQPGRVIADISSRVIPDLLSQFSGVEYALSGSSLEEQEATRDLMFGALAALFLIYALIAIPLKSYLQPLIIMSVIPFGFVGAVVGHLVLGQAISLFSLFGLIALAGVVVNDSLIMIDFVNKARATGMTAEQAVVQSGKARFRAIILTSLTTAVGLMPIMLEKSTQAQFVIPMAISLSFGIVFATLITLILVPSLYLLQLDVLRRFRQFRDWLLNRQPEIAVASKEG